jgi:hypothetical protein
MKFHANIPQKIKKELCMKHITTALLLVTLGLNTVQASCLNDFEARTDHNIQRDGAIGGLGAMVSFLGLIPVMGPFVLIPIGASATWVYKDLYLPSSATKMSELILDSILLHDFPERAEAILKQKPNALKRLDKVVLKATGLNLNHGDSFITARKEAARIITVSNRNRELCEIKLLKFKEMDEFVSGKL